MMKDPGMKLTVSQYSSRTFLLGTLWGTAFTAVAIRELVGTSQNFKPSSREWISMLFCVVLRLITTVFMWLIWWYKNRSEKVCCKGEVLCLMENTYHIAVISSISIKVITEVVNGECNLGTFSASHMYACNSFDSTRSIEPAYLMALIFIPVLAFLIMRDARLEALALTWSISVGTLVFCGVYMKSRALVLPIIAYVFITLLIFHDAKRQNDTVIGLVTALQCTAAENEKLQEEARATELRAMIGNVAHDLKTPLTSIVSGIECIEEAMRRVDELFGHERTRMENAAAAALEQVVSVRACLSGMLGTTSFMTMCINRCLDYTKASKGVKLVPRPETVNLLDAFTFPVKIMRDVQPQVVITVAPISPDICTHIITDKQWLLENLLCLLSNAVRYSQAGTVNVKVMIDGVSTKAADFSIPLYLRFEVWDTGIGLTSESMSALFAPFKQAQRLAGGTGLGLFSLAKRVEALHGSYGVSARPDGVPGSLFWFSIPYRSDPMSAALAISPRAEMTLSPRAEVDAAAASEGAPRAAPPELGGVRGRSHWKALVVDDAPSILKMTTMLLTKKGHHVEQATNGAVALQKVTASLVGSAPMHFDVVLMDLQMPVMDGVEAIRRIRSAECAMAKDGTAAGYDLECGHKFQTEGEKQGRQMIIALSANSDSDTMQEALDAGADHFMSKPFTYDDFCDLMTTTKRIN